MNLPFHISYTGLIIGTSISGGWCYLGGKGGGGCKPTARVLAGMTL